MEGLNTAERTIDLTALRRGTVRLLNVSSAIVRIGSPGSSATNLTGPVSWVGVRECGKAEVDVTGGVLRLEELPEGVHRISCLVTGEVLIEDVTHGQPSTAKIWRPRMAPALIPQQRS